MHEFRAGDMVEWSSQANGRRITKRGQVVEVVPPGVRPPSRSKHRDPGGARDHQSYLVHVPKRGEYWPVVNRLRAAASQEKEEQG